MQLLSNNMVLNLKTIIHVFRSARPKPSLTLVPMHLFDTHYQTLDVPTLQIDQMFGTNYFTVVTADITTYHIFMFWTRQRQMTHCRKALPPVWTLRRTCLNRHSDSSQQPSSQALLSWHVLWGTSGRFHIRSELLDIYAESCDTCELSAEFAM